MRRLHKGRTCAMQKRFLIAMVGLVALATIGSYVWRLNAELEELTARVNWLYLELMGIIPEFPEGMFQKDCPNYISNDGSIIVCGPKWKEDSIWVARKKDGEFGDFEKMLFKVVSSGSSGNYSIEAVDKSFRFENYSWCYSDQVIETPISCEVKENGEFVTHHLITVQEEMNWWSKRTR